MNILSLFDGISVGRLALEELSIEIDNYFASEIDKYAIAVAKYNYPNTIFIGDVTKVKAEYLPKIDLLIGGSPCQDLSGLKTNGLGLEGNKSRLLLEFIRLKNELKPKYFLLENVVPRKTEWLSEINNLIGANGVLLNSDLFVQQNRPRYYWTNIPIPPLPDRPNWQGKYFQWRRTYYRENKSGVCPCLTANMGTGGHNVPLHSKDKKDKLSPMECERLQSLPNDYTKFGNFDGIIKKISNSQRYKMIGNSWTKDVIKHIFNGLEVR